MQNQNPRIRRNSICFGIFTLIIHIIACVMFGVYFRLPGQDTLGNFGPLFITFAHGMLVIVGFGLLFSYLKRMVWSGMGFTLLITALSIELYFMINAFWTKAAIYYSADEIIHFWDVDKTYDLYLTNTSEVTDYMATLTGCFRCALAMMVAFSAILGRAGHFQALVVTFIGTIGYELNRQIIFNFTNDAGGTSSIFVFGGFMGLILGIMRKIKEKEKPFKDGTNTGIEYTKEHLYYNANRFSSSFALVGTLITWVFFPVLAADYIDTDVAIHTSYTAPYTVWYALAASTVTSFALSPIFNDGVQIRDIVFGPIAGGIVASTASYYVVNPVYGIVMGIVAALVQVVIMNLVEKKIALSKSIFNTFSFTLFGVQGMIGACFAAIWYAGVRSRKYGFEYNFPDDDKWNQVFAWIISLISAPMGVAFGLLAGLLLMFITKYERDDYFNDFACWRQHDGIREREPQAVINEGRSQIKGKHRYL